MAKTDTYLCPPHMFFLNTSVSNSGQCVPCKVCEKGYETVQPCTDTSDAVCSLCRPGTYKDGVGGSCKPCRTCKPGQYRTRMCRSTKDTRCKKCPPGSFSVIANVGICRTCRDCLQNERVSRPCSSKRDTVCGPCLKGLSSLLQRCRRKCTKIWSFINLHTGIGPSDRAKTLDLRTVNTFT